MMQILRNFMPSSFADTYKAKEYICELVNYVNALSEDNIGKEIEQWDYNFTGEDNRISMAVKVLQAQSVSLVINEVKKNCRRLSC